MQPFKEVVWVAAISPEPNRTDLSFVIWISPKLGQLYIRKQFTPNRCNKKHPRQYIHDRERRNGIRHYNKEGYRKDTCE
jgi:hypothetical protein